MCAPGSHAAGDVCEATLTGWTAGPLLLRARDHHVTFVATSAAGSYLYAMLGAGPSGTAETTVERAAIAEDGSLSAFEKTAAAPTGLIGPGFAQLDANFALAGGLTNDGNSTTSTFVGHVGDDGALTFTPGPDLAESRYHVTLSYARGFVFAIGGLHQDVSTGTPMQKVEDVVERASFDGTTLGAWTTLAPLDAPVTHHAAFVHQDAIYLIGGGSGAAATKTIQRATVAADGSLGAWEHAGDLPEGRATSSAFVLLDHLYVLAGMTSLTGGERDTVLRAPIDASGQVGAFEELPVLPKARAHSHQAPVFGNHVYSVAGSINHVGQKDAFIGTFE
jgi:hypothetical protein